ncbi:MAG: hypothetical protein DHS80DRAFT_33597 [Piptocephalis tieghemiana]|nr:MAG: hypothetical protein DHS80DRAFT_33597 [Piptocephalis tieghemiana]
MTVLSVTRARGSHLFQGYAFWLDPSLDLAEREEVDALGKKMTDPPVGNVMGISYNQSWCLWSLHPQAPIVTPIKTQDKELIYAGVLALGGQWREDTMAKDLTHLLALSLEDITANVQKIHGTPGSPNSINYVAPHWAHVGLGSKHQPKILSPPAFPISSRAEEASASPYIKSLHPLYRKQLLMEPSLLEAMGMKTRRTLLHLLVGCEAKLLPGTVGPNGSVESMDMADMVICQYRTGSFYDRALREGKIIGSLIWLRCILERREWISPYSQLLLYPFPTSMIPGMSQCIISITNYDETSKEYLIHLIQMAGATYTASLTSNNTHLVCGATRGPKYEAASTWGKDGGMVIVNHLWLEECCQLWSLQSVTRPRYQWFPPISGLLPGLVGTTPGSPRVIKDSILKEEEKDAQGGRFISIVIDEEEDRMDVDQDNSTRRDEMIEADGVEDQGLEGKGGSEVSKDHGSPLQGDEEGASSPKSDDSKQADEPKDTPHTQGNWAPRRRTAAKEASKALAGLMQVANEYEAQRKKDAMANKKRSHRAIKSSTTEKKDLEEEEEEGEEEEGEEGADGMGDSTMSTPRGSKKQKGISKGTSSAQPSPSPKSSSSTVIRALFTGIKVTEKEIQGIKALGGKIAGSARDCTHLIAEAAARTEKFLVGISVAQWIVTKAWLQDSLKEGRWLEESPYVLCDEQAERSYDFSLVESLKRAKKSKLFASKVIYVTGKTHPPPATLKPLIEASGGKLVKQVSGRRVEDVGDRLIVISCPQDHSQWTPFLERTPPLPIYSVELILTGLLRQSLDGAKEEFRLDLE